MYSLFAPRVTARRVLGRPDAGLARARARARIVLLLVFAFFLLQFSPMGLAVLRLRGSSAAWRSPVDHSRRVERPSPAASWSCLTVSAWRLRSRRDDSRTSKRTSRPGAPEHVARRARRHRRRGVRSRTTDAAAGALNMHGALREPADVVPGHGARGTSARRRHALSALVARVPADRVVAGRRARRVVRASCTGSRMLLAYAALCSLRFHDDTVAGGTSDSVPLLGVILNSILFLLLPSALLVAA